MSAPSSGQERRQNPRARVEPLAYISIEPDNGGIVLNVSDGGLCFHCTAPIRPTNTVHFWLSTRNQRIEGEAELAWMDVSQKKGGLRFTKLSSEGREQLREWIGAPLLPVTPERSAVSISYTASAPVTKLPQIVAEQRPSRELATRSQPAIRSFRGFTGGLVTGLAIATVLAAGFAFYAYHRQIGESLIYWGERLTGRSNPEPVSPTTATARTQADVMSQRPAAGSSVQKVAPEPVTTSMSPTKLSSESRNEVQPIRVVQPQITNPAAAAAPVPPRISMNGLPSKAPVLPNASAMTRVEIARSTIAAGDLVPGSNVPVPSKMYFDIGKFKEHVQAQQTADNLGQLGFTTAVIQKKNVWKNSYQVLVGPYSYDEKAEAAHRDLLSRGFPARAVERGSRKFVLRGGLTLNKNRMPAGEYTISWESYVTHAKVKFVQHDSAITSAEGRWVKNEAGYENDAVIYRINDDGSKTLLEILFAGMDRALTFR